MNWPETSSLFRLNVLVIIYLDAQVTWVVVGGVDLQEYCKLLDYKQNF